MRSASAAAISIRSVQMIIIFLPPSSRCSTVGVPLPHLPSRTSGTVMRIFSISGIAISSLLPSARTMTIWRICLPSFLSSLMR